MICNRSSDNRQSWSFFALYVLWCDRLEVVGNTLFHTAFTFCSYRHQNKEEKCQVQKKLLNQVHVLRDACFDFSVSFARFVFWRIRTKPSVSGMVGNDIRLFSFDSHTSLKDVHDNEMHTSFSFPKDMGSGPAVQSVSQADAAYTHCIHAHVQLQLKTKRILLGWSQRVDGKLHIRIYTFKVTFGLPFLTHSFQIAKVHVRSKNWLKPLRICSSPERLKFIRYHCNFCTSFKKSTYLFIHVFLRSMGHPKAPDCARFPLSILNQFIYMLFLVTTFFCFSACNLFRKPMSRWKECSINSERRRKLMRRSTSTYHATCVQAHLMSAWACDRPISCSFVLIRFPSFSSSWLQYQALAAQLAAKGSDE